MKLTGVEVPFDALSHPEPDTTFVVISDANGAKKLIKIDNQSIVDSELVLRVIVNATDEGAQLQGGCYVSIGGKLTWVDPCPH